MTILDEATPVACSLMELVDICFLDDTRPTKEDLADPIETLGMNPNASPRQAMRRIAEGKIHRISSWMSAVRPAAPEHNWHRREREKNGDLQPTPDPSAAE
jgi:hypothetical protein